MSSILNEINHYTGWLVLGLCVLVIGLVVTVIVQALRLNKVAASWSSLMDGATSGNIEHILYDHLRERVRIETDLAQIQKRLDQLEFKMSTAQRYVGLTRFDAFDDVGGEQSFALAVYDEKGRGAVITSIVGRSSCRVYCKELANGRADRDLSREEQKAVEAAGTARAGQQFVNL